MELNFNCFRKILLYVEKYCVYEDTVNGRKMHEVSLYELCNADELKEFDEETKHYTVAKLFEGNYVEGKFVVNNYGKITTARINSLTMKGHNMIDNISNELIWNQAVELINKNGKVSIDILAKEVGQAAMEFSKRTIGDSIINSVSKE